ncbi:MAG TPA: ATP-binding cassette domain-containing protein [Acidimicrobiales bacterium]|nr:ATP-binding cassette domain-containing protein [Acidimicrobiales bacterium]
MITFEAVSFAYPTASGAESGSAVLRDVEVEVPAGEFLLVAGASGSGKSTLLRAVNGLVPHATGGRFSGTVTTFGRTTRDHPPRSLADVVGFVHQDPEAQFVVDHVEGDLAFVLENLGHGRDAMRRRVEEVLDALDIAHLRHRSPATLSGGERQRCAIAGALAAAPSALVLDEPTSQLDPQGAEDVLGAIARLNADLGTTIVLAEHRLDRAAPPADRAIRIVEGRIVDSGHAGHVLATYDGAPAVTRLGRLLGWMPPPLTVKEARRHAASQVDPPSATMLTAARASAPGDPLVTARGLRVELDARPVLHDVDVDVRAGEVVALLGRNGAGKTTLLRSLAGLQRADRGSITVAGRAAYVPQDPNSLLFAPTVRREIEHTLRLLGRSDPPAVDAWLTALHLEAVADRHPRSLSGGERQRVAIAAVAVGGAEVLLLDEPTRGMDAPSRTALQHAVERHAANGGAVVLATHDIELAARCATRAVVLGDGDVVAEGEARHVLTGSLFAPQVLRVLPPFLTVEEVAAALDRSRR